MVLDLAPQVFADAGPGFVTGKPGQERSDEAVVLVGQEVELLVVNADRVPPVEEVAQLILQSGRPIPSSRRYGAVPVGWRYMLTLTEQDVLSRRQICRERSRSRGAAVTEWPSRRPGGLSAFSGQPQD